MATEEEKSRLDAHERWLRELNGNIRYHENLLRAAKLLDVPTSVYIEEQTIKYLKELRGLRKP